MTFVKGHQKVYSFVADSITQSVCEYMETLPRRKQSLATAPAYIPDYAKPKKSGLLRRKCQQQISGLARAERVA